MAQKTSSSVLGGAVGVQSAQRRDNHMRLFPPTPSALPTGGVGVQAARSVASSPPLYLAMLRLRRCLPSGHNTTTRQCRERAQSWTVGFSRCPSAVRMVAVAVGYTYTGGGTAGRRDGSARPSGPPPSERRDRGTLSDRPVPVLHCTAHPVGRLVASARPPRVQRKVLGCSGRYHYQPHTIPKGLRPPNSF